MGELARDIRALTQQVATLRAELERYRADLRDALDRLLDQYPTLCGATSRSQPRPRPHHQHRSPNPCDDPGIPAARYPPDKGAIPHVGH